MHEPSIAQQILIGCDKILFSHTQRGYLFLFLDYFLIFRCFLLFYVIINFYKKYFIIIILLHFFFQAEDGIRDRSPSRGLGDVYKRQALIGLRTTAPRRTSIAAIKTTRSFYTPDALWPAVSYTHLTLPTKRIV